MAELKFRDLRADEIDVRIATVKPNGMSLLLYKDARCDMNILDETVGAYNWQRSHSRDNANCTVSIYDVDKGQWICKEDVGTESNTEAQKGLASDSFKRACFNWGIGRELYTAPFIWIGSDKFNDKYDKFSVEAITIEDKKITALTIMNDTKGMVVYSYGKGSKGKAAQAKKTTAASKAPVAPVAPAATVVPDSDDKPYEVVTETGFRDRFRALVAGWDSKLIGQIVREFNLQDASPDSAWQPAVEKAIAIKGGAKP